MTTRGFAREVLNALGTELTNRGFEKRTGEIFTTSVGRDVVGWLGLNKARATGAELVIAPVVGVRHNTTERIVAEALDENPHPYIPPTLSVQLGYVMPDAKQRSWSFRAGEDIHPVILDSVDAICRWGRKFMDQISNPVELLGMLRSSPFAVPDLARFRVPALLLQADQPVEAMEYIERQFDELEGRNDAAALQYRRFGEQLRRIAQSSTLTINRMPNSDCR